MLKFRSLWRWVTLRRLVQVAMLLVFLGLVVAAQARGGERMPSAWLKAFFAIDPLLLIATALSAHAVPALLLASLGLVAVTLVLGRVFCGWVCPLGTLHDIASRVLFWIWPDRRRRDHWSPWQRTKYLLLVGLLVMALFGSHWGTIFDPLVLLYRTTTTALLPALQWGVQAPSTAIYHYDPETAPAPVRPVAERVHPFVRDYASEPAYEFLRDHVFGLRTHTFLGGGLILGFFLLTLALNRYRPRFWCRYLCPLGALLGIFSLRPLVRRAVQTGNCNQCDLCATSCHGAASGAPGEQWKAAECLGCLNCTDSCRRDGLRFTLTLPWRKEPPVEGLDLSRRSVFGAALGGVAGLCLLRITPQARGSLPQEHLIRPPGSLPEREFLERCTSCGMCIKICPTHGLQPALWEAGLEGLWTPRLVPRLGWCESECTACTHVCPTQAIRPLTVEQKKQVRIGLASFDVTRCIPYAYGRECIVCEEHCPVPDKAIYVVETEVIARNGQKIVIKQPRVDPSRCIGCGICENKCPLTDHPGVRVLSTNESRSDYQAIPVTPDEVPLGEPADDDDDPYAADR
ncbi:MAG TPA: 4Fe-4S binding protein [Candidatus Anammoximicrobium sp.]|nr:4Fe-4S binding protein [Candidatus Anammoximicrobium sp.]